MNGPFLKRRFPSVISCFSQVFSSDLPSFFLLLCTVMIVYIHLAVVCFACSKSCDRDMQVDRYNFIFHVDFFVNKLCLWKKNTNKIKILSKSCLFFCIYFCHRSQFKSHLPRNPLPH